MVPLPPAPPLLLAYTSLGLFPLRRQTNKHEGGRVQVLDAWAQNWHAVTSASSFCPQQVTKPAQIQKLGKQTPSLIGRSQRIPLQRVWTQGGLEDWGHSFNLSTTGILRNLTKFSRWKEQEPPPDFNSIVSQAKQRFLEKFMYEKPSGKCTVVH